MIFSAIMPLGYISDNRAIRDTGAFASTVLGTNEISLDGVECEQNNLSGFVGMLKAWSAASDSSYRPSCVWRRLQQCKEGARYVLKGVREMKLSLECSIKGWVKIDRQIKVEEGPKEYSFIPDSKGWLSSIKIIKKVATPQKYSARWEPGEGKVDANLVIEGDREEYLELVREFQELESVLSFATNGSLKSIAWDEPKEDFIPETEEEKRQVGVYSFHFTKEYPDYPMSLDERVLDDIIKSKKYYKSLIVPKAFFRDGTNEFTSRRYINAFYNFYFILEDLYGKGKTKNKDIADAFRNSRDFREILEWMIKEQIDKIEKHRISLKRFCEEEKVTYDVDGVIDLIQKVRGNLHHYSSKSSKHSGTPFSHEDFESIAFLTMGLAVQIILRKIVDINQSMGMDKKRR